MVFSINWQLWSFEDNVMLFKNYLGFALCLGMLCFVKGQTNKKYDVLIVDGFSNHDWIQTTKLVRDILENSELFEISISTVPSEMGGDAWNTWLPKFGDYDVVLQNTNNVHDPTLRWPGAAEKALEKYLKSGGGLYIFHSANNAFPHWEEYNMMIGLGWRKKDEGIALRVTDERKVVKIASGEGQDTYHGPRNDEVIERLNDHPINNGMPKSWKTPDIELYKFARGPAKELTILSYAKDEERGINWPVEWVVGYGKGRVYNSSMGHLWEGDVYPVGYRCVGFQTTLIRATEWLASGNTTYAIPNNFPTENKISLIEPKK